MNIVFMGTPEFAVPCLKALIESGENVQAVFTQPDKPKGRGHKMIATPVKECAVANNIPVYQPLSLRKGDDAENALEVLKELKPDLIIVVAYGQILPEEVLYLPEHHCINIHASLLPRYRGAAPIQWCILNGEKVTGVTSMLMAKGLDTGDMLISEEIPIGENETGSELHDRLSELGAEVLLKTIRAVKENSLKPVSQNDSLSNYAPMITKQMSAIDFSQPAEKVHNTIRAITGFAVLDGKRIKMYRSEIAGSASGSAGTVINAEKFEVVCGDGTAIRLLEVQGEGGKRLKTADFLRGYKISEGMSFDKI